MEEDLVDLGPWLKVVGPWGAIVSAFVFGIYI